MAKKTPLTVKQRVRDFLKQRRRRMTQADLAGRIGITPSHLSDILNGKTPSLHVAVDLEDITGVPARDFVGVGVTGSHAKSVGAR